MVNYCKCHGCRWPHCHLTEYHLCGKCQQFGHGQQECGNQNALASLAPGPNDPNQLPQNEQCTVMGCNHAHSHTSGSHTDGFIPGANPIPIPNNNVIGLPAVQQPQPQHPKKAQKKPTKSTLQDKQIEWLKDKLHPDCYGYVDANSFLTDTVHHVVKGLNSARKEYPNESIYTFCSHGSQHVMYGILEHGHKLARVSSFKFDDHNAVRDFIHGYRMVSLDPSN